MPSELPGVTTIDIGNKNVAKNGIESVTGKNDIESTSTGLKKKVTLGLLLVLLIAAVGSTAAAVVVILGKDNQVAAPPEEAAADAPQVISVTVNAPGDSNTIFKSAVERLPSGKVNRFHLIVQYKSTADDDPLCTHLIHVDGVETKFISAAAGQAECSFSTLVGADCVEEKVGSPTDALSADAIIDIIGGRQGNNVTVLAADEASFIVPEFCEFSHSTGTNSTEAIEWSRSRLDEDTGRR